VRSKLPWPEIIVTALVVAAGAGVYAYAHRDESALEESKRRGEQLVAALDAYQRERGSFPEQLDELVPGHIATVEQPTWGLQRWRYRRYSTVDAVPSTEVAAAEAATADRVYFQLSVAADESGYPVLYYDFTARRWVLNN
jgi:hypothetical protein